MIQRRHQRSQAEASQTGQTVELHQAAHHIEMLRARCNVVTDLIRSDKRQHYTDRISACGQDQKQLFWIVRGLLKTKDISTLPKHISDQELADTFNEYFANKIANIRNTTGTAAAVEEAPLTDGLCSLDQFTSTSELELAKILNKMSATTRELDSIRFTLVKENLDVLLPTIAATVNQSLQSGTFPPDLKLAMVRPLLEKPNSDAEELKKNTGQYQTWPSWGRS